MIKRLRIALRVLLISAIFFSACSLGQKSNYIDDRFLETYHELQWNGKYILGDAISHVTVDPETNIEQQYFENGILVYDPAATPRFYLEPVGVLVNEGSPEHLELEASSSPNIQGFRTIEAFLAAYEEIGGERWIGNPVTHVYEVDDGLYRQDFESLGFYRYESDPPGVVRFLPYGLWRQQQINKVDLVEIEKFPLDNQPTITEQAAPAAGSNLEQIALAELGINFLGANLSGVYQADDGHLEIVFENVVVYEDPGAERGFSLRPIGKTLHTSKMTRGADQEGWVFRILKGRKGFMIPDYFDLFIQANGGYSLSGEPISELVLTENRITEQCFENYCLRYTPKKEQGQVSLIPLGENYDFSPADAQVESTPQESTAPVPTRVPENFPQESPIELGVWHFLNQISSSDKQEIGACASLDGEPLLDYSAELTIFLPGGQEKTYRMDEPDQGGCVFQTLSRIRADNGEMIHYQVCVEADNLGVRCGEGQFLMWGNP